MLGPGKTQNVSKEEIYLIQELTVRINVNIVLTFYSEDYKYLHFWFWINYDIFFTFFSKQILILCLSTFVLKHCMWKRILTSIGCQKMAWLKTLSRSLKNTSRPGDCWYAEGWNALVICLFLILLLCWKSLCAMLGFLSKSKVSQYKHLCLCVSQPLRICILGPPAVGKSTIAERICKHYKLHHVKLKETITETLDNLVSVIQHTAFIQKNQSIFK